MSFLKSKISSLKLDVKEKYQGQSDKVWLLNLDQIEQHTGKILSKEFVNLSEIGNSTHYFSKGTLLYSKLRPYLNKVVIADTDGFATTELVPIHCDLNKVVPSYLAYFLRSEVFLTFATNVVAGAKMPRMVMGEFWNYEIPLPPLSEQRRIASILDKADELRQKRQQVIEKLDQLLQATFIDMFGDPVSNPKGWQRIPSKNVLKIQGGYAFSSKDFSDTGIPVVKIGNANKLGFNTEKFDFITPKYPEKLTQYELKSGDLLMSLTGTVGKDDYGNITEVTDDYDLYYLNQRVAKLEVINPLFSKNYIRYFFSQSSIKGLITKNNRGVRQANISNTDIYELDILLPTRELLDKFDLCIKSINKMKRTFQMQLSSSNRLFNSLQNQAFSGTL
ncbi:type I restriction modification DNA specificity domain protein [Acinetobacter baumannii 1412924]|uniref:restriction endonuclease subunit S n=1 Tax=Acinetobacter baumannii TaxID=470 RepID=UPI00044FCD30|nr:restriction endonuclease subunit S [Acinetobacter baumannii]EXH49373.1 type I restriction modification DNA specificity domain protein [Acinetobacter baumannii 1412924]